MHPGGGRYAWKPRWPASNPDIHRYDAAHAFFNERSAAYDIACANQAWERMAEFLKAKLS